MIPLKSFGDSNLLVSRVGLGLAALGRPAYINLGHHEDLGAHKSKENLRSQAHDVLSEAFKQGIRYFDAARSYGLSESFLASWLDKHPNEDNVIGSKWGYTYTANWQMSVKKHEIKEHSLRNLNKQIQESTELLGKQLDLYQIHSATPETGILTNKAVHERLYELKQNGLLIGLSLSGTKQKEALLQALRVTLKGERLFDSVQATFNVFETSAKDALELAKKEGMGIIIKEALANGRLTQRNTNHEIQAITKQANRLSVTEDALALAWVLQHDWVDTVLSGAATKQHLKSNLNALNISLDEEAIEELKKLEQSPETYWKTRSSLAWN